MHRCEGIQVYQGEGKKQANEVGYRGKDRKCILAVYLLSMEVNKGHLLLMAL